MPQLAQLIRTKYPGQYDDMSDSDLEKAVLAKYPEYADLATKDHNNPTPEVKDDKPISQDTSKPDNKATDEEPTGDKQPVRKGFLSKAWDAVSKPLTDHLPEIDNPVNIMRNYAQTFEHPKADDSKLTAMLKGFAGGASEGLENVVTGLTSPLNLALTATGAAEASPALEAMRPALSTARKLMSGAVAAEGGVHAFNAPSMAGKLGGIAEAVLGLAGAAGHGSEGSIDRSPELNTPSPEIPSESTNTGPGISPSELPPDLVSVGSEDQFNSVRPTQGIPNPEDRIMQIVQNEQGMGKEIPESEMVNSGPAKDEPLTFDEANDRLNQLIDKEKAGTLSSRELPEAKKLDSMLRDANFDKDTFNKINGIKNESSSSSSLDVMKSSLEDNSTQPKKELTPDDIDALFSKPQGKSTGPTFRSGARGINTDDVFPSAKAEPEVVADRAANPNKPRYRLDNKSGGLIPINEFGATIGPPIYPKGGPIDTVPQGRQPDLGFESLEEKLKRLTHDGGSGEPPKRGGGDQAGFGFGKDDPNAGGSNYSLFRKIMDTPKGLMTVDLPFLTSAAFRQANPYMGTLDWFKAFVPAAKSYGSKAAFDAINDEILNHPNFRGASYADSSAGRSGLKLSDLGKYTNREEALRAGFAEKIPGYGKVIQASNRAYTAFLNSLRSNRFNTLVDALKEQGIDTPKSRTEVAEAINTMTGRGKLSTGGIGKWDPDLEKHVELLNNTFFAPRKIASEVRMLNPNTYAMTNPVARQEMLKGLVRRAATWWTIAGLAKVAGADVSTDPTNPDFGKIKIGNTRIDVPGGLQQFLVLTAQTVSGGKTSSSTGKFNEFGKGFKPETAGSNIATFITNKLAPVPKAVWDASTATPRDPFHTGDRIMQLASPIMISDLAQAIQSSPELAPLVGLTSGVGIGTQSYERGSFGKPTFIPEQYDFNIGAKSKH